MRSAWRNGGASFAQRLLFRLEATRLVRIAAQVAEETGYPSPVLAAREHMSEETANSTLIFPSQEEIEKGEFQNSVGEMDVLYEQLFERLKTSR